MRTGVKPLSTLQVPGSAPEKRGERLALWCSIFLISFGCIARVASLRFNEFPHGDVTISALVAHTIHQKGTISIPFVHARTDGVQRFEGSTPLDYRPPLWPIMAVCRQNIPDSRYRMLRDGSWSQFRRLLPLDRVAFFAAWCAA